MKINLNTRFQYNGKFYEVDNPTDYDVITYVYDSEDAAIPYLSTNAQFLDFSDFYKLGWTKAEVQEGIKKDWQICYTRGEIISYIYESLPWVEMEDFITPETWEKFPARKIFDSWLTHDFENAWDEDEENDAKEHPLANASLQRLFSLMEKPGNLALLKERKIAC